LVALGGEGVGVGEVLGVVVVGVVVGGVEEVAVVVVVEEEVGEEEEVVEVEGLVLVLALVYL
jgi:hypothetical protein